MPVLPVWEQVTVLARGPAAGFQSRIVQARPAVAQGLYAVPVLMPVQFLFLFQLLLQVLLLHLLQLQASGLFLFPLLFRVEVREVFPGGRVAQGRMFPLLSRRVSVLPIPRMFRAVIQLLRYRDRFYRACSGNIRRMSGRFLTRCRSSWPKSPQGVLPAAVAGRCRMP